MTVPASPAHEFPLRIALVRRSLLRVRLTTGLLMNGAVTITPALVLIAMEAAVGFSSPVRTAIVLAYLVGALLSTGWLVGRPLLQMKGFLQAESDEDIARRIGAYFPTLRDRLLNALQLIQAADGNRGLYSSELADEALRECSAASASFDFARCVDVRPLPRAARWFAMSVMLAGLLAAAFPAPMSDAMYRLLHFDRQFASAPQFKIVVTPGDCEVIKGGEIDITVRLMPTSRFGRPLPSELTLFRRVQGQEVDEESELHADSGNVFRMHLSGLRTTLDYRVRTASVMSATYRILVLDRPLIRSLRLRLDAPAYSAIPPRIQDEFTGDITALPGTRVTITGNASKPLGAAGLSFADNSEIPLTIHGSQFSGSFTIRSDNSYTIDLIDTDTLTNIDPVRYGIKTTTDLPPTVAIVEPGRDVDVAGDAAFTLRIHATDDFGVSRLRLAHRLVRSRFEEAAAVPTFITLPFPRSATVELDREFNWPLSEMHLVPEDVVEYYVEAEDNDAVRGPKTAKSQVYRLRLPSLEEVFAEAEHTQEQSLDEIGTTLDEARKLKENIESIDRDLKTNKNPDWQTQNKIAEMAKRYQNLQAKIDEAQNRLQQMTEQLQQQNMLSPETMEKYSELQQLFQQLNSTELQKMLKQMQQSMPNISKEQLRQAMQQATFSEERFRQNIERTLNLLKRIQIEQKIDEVKKRADALAAAQQELEQRAIDPRDQRQQDEAVNQQERLADAENTLEREAVDLQRRMEEFFTEMPAGKMQTLSEQLQEQQLNQQMRRAAGMMRQGNRSDARRTQQRVQQQLEQFRNQVEALQQEMLQQQSRAVMNELRKASYNLLELSRRQEELKKEAEASPQDSPHLRENAQRQQQVTRDLQNLVNALNELSQRSFAVTPEMGRSIGEAMMRMNGAQQRLDLRNGPYAAQEQGQAMASLNKAAMQVQAAMAQMAQSGGSGMGGLLQQLQSMAGQQMALNMQTRELGDGISAHQASEAVRLAKEQEAIRKSVEQLNREAEASGDRERLLGDLRAIADEMKEVVRNLEQNEVNRETLRKQERIVSRLLDASRSMRERDYEKKRKAQTGTPIPRRSPGELDPSVAAGTSKLREELMKALERGYAKDYQELIRRYFEKLEEKR